MKKEKYIVNSGKLLTIVYAINERMAAITAINLYLHLKLGVIISVLKEDAPKDHELYYKTDFILECMDIKSVKRHLYEESNSV